MKALSGSLSIFSKLALIGTLLTVPVLAGNNTNYDYLALGDSVAFGLDVRLLAPNLPPPSPSVFVGYHETVAGVQHWLQSKKEVNASCPGETSGSFMTPGVPDYGCHSNGPQGQPPFKSSIGLKADYPGTQLSFAVSQLSTNKHIDLVTLGIGSNDVLLLLAQCAQTADPTVCVNTGIPAVLQNYGQNLAQILAAIRTQAGYTGKLILVEYYSPTIALIPIAEALNATTLSVGAQFGAVFADGFMAFQLASAPYGGDPCKAGLLVQLPDGTCDIHPSPLGRNVLAGAVEVALAGFKF
jgi:lysophospholipase L1-like esterase